MSVDPTTVAHRPHRPQSRARRPRRLALSSTLALAGVLILAAIALTHPGAALARGWLAGWLFCLSLSVGASVWFLVWHLTGGRWMRAGHDTLASLAAAAPLLALGAVGFIVAVPSLFPWAGTEQAPLRAGYLNVPFFTLRTVLVLALWSALGMLARRRLAPSVAGLLILAYGVSVTVASTDWILSADPAFGSTAFASYIAVIQFGSALAVAAVARLDTRDPVAVADWGGLMLATLLGVLYLAAMQYLVVWSGDLPHKAGWYLARLSGGGRLAAALAFLLGGLIPFVILLMSRWRADAGWLRRAGACMLVAAFVHLLWLVGSWSEDGGAGIAVVAAAAVTAFLAGAVSMWRMRHD